MQLPVRILKQFSFTAVMGYLATQQRESLSLGADSVVLQSITMDELQLASRQAQQLNIDANLVDSIVGMLGQWMTAGAPLMSC